MSPKQNSLYWREWSAVRKKLAADPSAPAADRHALHIEALGADKSHHAFTNTDFDKVLAAFRAVTRPADLDAQLRQINQDRTRTLHAIQRHDHPYIAAIALERFQTSDYTQLPTPKLKLLAMTLTERRRAKARKAAPEPVNEPF
jgi:hypothetical protein